MTELFKPCPFCGRTDLKSGGDDKFVGIQCMHCEAHGPNHYGKYRWEHRATDQNTRPTLLPCPFCEGPADFIGKESAGYNVECKHCGARSGWGDYGFQVEAKWNSRADTRPTPSTEELKDLVHEALQDSMDFDWSTSVGAEHVVRALTEAGFLTRPTPSSDVAELAEKLMTRARTMNGGLPVGASDGCGTIVPAHYSIRDRELDIAASRALARLSPPAQVVKPLEWKNVRVPHGPETYEAHTPVGFYQVFTDEDSAAGSVFSEWAWDQNQFGMVGATSLGRFPTFEAAEAAAQADYERRILSALAPAQVEVTDEMVRRGRKEAGRQILAFGCSIDNDHIRAILTAALTATDAKPVAHEHIEVTDAGLQGFAEWFRKNYPGPDTLIHKPDWHSPKIYRAALHHARSPDAKPVVPAEPVAKGMPERIWAFQSDGGQRGWLHTKPPRAIIDLAIEYVRSDLAAPPSTGEGEVERQSLADLESALSACEDGVTRADVLANYRAVRRTVQSLHAHLASEGKTDA